MHIPALNEADLHFRDLLLQHQLLNEKQLEQVLTAREQTWEKLLKEVQGRFCGIAAGQLFMALPDGTRVLEVPLQSAASPTPPVAAVILNPADGRLLQSVALPGAELGLRLTDESVFIDAQDPLQLPIRAEGLCYQGHPDHDLCLSPRRDLLLVSERFEGQLKIVSLVTNQLLASVQLREPGSYKALNMAVAPRGDRAWITDQESDQLLSLDLSSFDLRRQRTGQGTLGNLCLDPEGKSLWIISLAPLFQLICLRPDTLEILQEIPLSGFPMSLQPDMPSDPLSLAHNGKTLYVMALQEDQGEDQPIVQLIDLTSHSLLGTQPLQLNHLPRLLAEGEANPLLSCRNKRLEDWVVELGFLSAENLVRLRQGLTSDESTAYEPPQGDEPPWELLQREAPPIRFTEGALAVIQELLLRTFFQETQIDLREDAREMRRVTEAAEQALTYLLTHYVALVELEGLLGEHLLQALITREALLQALDFRLSGRELPFKPANRCPICQLALRAPRLCHSCGFQLDDPAWSERREKQSAEACSELLPGQLLLALPHVGQLVLLNPWQQVIQEWKAEDSHCEEPVDALALPDKGYLVVDRKGAQLVELDPEGKPLYRFDHPFVAPVSATFYRLPNGEQRTLVVDRDAHQVLEFDAAGKYTAQWGVQGEVLLKEPQDVQRTWNETLLISDTGQQQVVEIQPDGSLVQRWGPEQKLQRPVLARRLLNGETLIIDAGRGEMLTYGEDQRLVRHFQYWPPPRSPAFLARQPAPDRFLVLSQSEVIALGRKYWMYLQVAQGKVRWIQPWTGERRPPSLKKFIEQVIDETPVMQALRKVSFLRQAEAVHLKLLAECLKPQRVAAGEKLIQQGSMGSALFFLIEGEVEVRRDEQPEPVATLQPGDIFGEISLMLSEPRTADVVTTTPCYLLQLERGELKKVLAGFPDLARNLRNLARERKALLQHFYHRMQDVVMQKAKYQMLASRLSGLGFFEDPPPGVIEKLAAVMPTLALMPDQTLFTQGESGDTLYFIARGTLQVYLDDDPEPVAQLEAGEIVGEMAVLADIPRSSTVRSANYCQLYGLQIADLQAIAPEYPALLDRLKALAAEREAQLKQIRAQRAERPPEPEKIRQAEVTATGAVRPLNCYLLSGLHEELVCLNQTGEILSSHSRKNGLALYQPFRLHQAEGLCWIADSGNDRVLCFDGQRLRLELGPDRLDLQQPRSIVPTPQGTLLIADEGNQRLLLVSEAGEKLWEYTTPHEILAPVYAEMTPTGTVLFCDRGLHQILEVDPRSRELIWSYGELMLPGDAPEQLNGPGCARRMANGATLIADTGNDRLLLISPVGKLMRTLYGSEDLPLNHPLHCELLPSGEILVYSELRAEVLRFNLAGQPIWRAVLND